MAEIVQGGVTGEGSWGSNMSCCAAHLPCMGFDVNVHYTSILRAVLYHCAPLIHLSWGSVSLCAAHPFCVGYCVIVRCISILRGVLYRCALLIHLAWGSVIVRCTSILHGFHVMVRCTEGNGSYARRGDEVHLRSCKVVWRR